MGDIEFVQVPVNLYQAILNYVRFGSFPVGVTVQDIIRLNDAMLKAAVDSGIEIIEQPEAVEPEDALTPIEAT